MNLLYPINFAGISFLHLQEVGLFKVFASAYIKEIASSIIFMFLKLEIWIYCESNVVIQRNEHSILSLRSWLWTYGKEYTCNSKSHNKI